MSMKNVEVTIKLQAHFKKPVPLTAKRTIVDGLVKLLSVTDAKGFIVVQDVQVKVLS
jgi:hypothetical protein